MFSRGQKVVCVDDEFEDTIKDQYTALPVRNEVYTVRDCYMGHDVVRRDEVALLLEELTNPVATISGVEKGFRAERFAPLIPDMEEESEEAVEILVPAGDKGRG